MNNAQKDAFYSEFEFDLPEALLKNLISAFDVLEPALLCADNVKAIPNAQGVYQIFYDGKLVYVGKSDAEAGLKSRLERHALKVLHRRSLDTTKISFKAIRIFVFTAIDLESQLIKHYSTADDGENSELGKVAWNGSGFGANDPGRARDKSKPGLFDTRYPIDTNVKLEIDFSKAKSAAEALMMLKDALPYTLRFETILKSRRPHGELADTLVEIPKRFMSAREVIEEIWHFLPTGWQATALHPLIIIYKERNINYPSAEVLAQS